MSHASSSGSSLTIITDVYRCEVSAGGIINSFILNGDDHGENGSVNLVADSIGWNRLCLYDDVPLFWDAWDVEAYCKEKPIPLGGNDAESSSPLGPVKLLSLTDGICVLETSVALSAHSSAVMTLTFRSGTSVVDVSNEIHWYEDRRLLRALFGVNVVTEAATVDCQFGAVKYPTHRNDSHALGQFEVCGQRWAAVDEHNRGVAVIVGDSPAGWSFDDFRTPSGTPFSENGSTTMGLSMLRSPMAPDPNIDRGVIKMRYCIVPHYGGDKRVSTWQTSGVVELAASYDDLFSSILQRSTSAEEVFMGATENEKKMYDSLRVAPPGRLRHEKSLLWCLPPSETEDRHMQWSDALCAVKLLRPRTGLVLSSVKLPELALSSLSTVIQSRVVAGAARLSTLSFEFVFHVYEAYGSHHHKQSVLLPWTDNPENIVVTLCDGLEIPKHDESPLPVKKLATSNQCVVELPLISPYQIVIVRVDVFKTAQNAKHKTNKK